MMGEMVRDDDHLPKVQLAWVHPQALVRVAIRATPNFGPARDDDGDGAGHAPTIRDGGGPCSCPWSDRARALADAARSVADRAE